MKKLLSLVLLCFALTGCYTRVPSGYSGIEVDLYGTNRGTQVQPISTGGVWYNPWTTEVHKFPTFTQTHTWDTEANNAFQFDTVEGMRVGADISLVFHVDPTKTPLLFQKYRMGLTEITEQYMATTIRNSLVNKASRLPIETVYGQGKEALLAAVKQDVSNQVGPYGIVVEQIAWAGSLNLPDAVLKAINAKINATQEAQMRRNEVEKTKAEADKAREEAMGIADAALTRAKAEAESISIRGQALRENPGLVELEAVRKWNGVLPQYSMGGAVPFVQLPSPK